MSFADIIFHHALTRPEKPAIILADRVVTYGMMAQGILSVEDRLRALGLKPGDLVAVAIESPTRHLIVSAALFRLGHPTLSVRHTREIPSIELPIAIYLEGAREGLVPGLNQALVDDDWFTGPSRRFDATPSKGFPDGDAICRISFSSGTTGPSKMSSQSVDAFNRMVLCYYLSLGQGDWDRMLSLPMLSSLWVFSVAAHALYAGKTLCFAGTERDTLHMIAVYNIDCLVCSVPNLQLLLSEQRKSPIPTPSLRVILTGGSLHSRQVLSELRAAICSTIIVQYGSTEAGGTAFAMADRLMETEGAVGFVTPWSQVEVVDAEGRVLPPDTDGILRVRSLCQARPYPDDGSNRDTSFRDGWFYPGDLGRVTEDGMLILLGRNSEIIKAGGAKVPPEMIEDVMRRHPAVADAAALAGIGVSGIEEVWVAIVARTPIMAPELVSFCAAQGIRVDRVVAVDRIPRNQLGKIERERLRRSL